MMSRAINYTSLQYLQSLLTDPMGHKREIIDLEVKNKWLVATLGQGTYFSVKNNET